MKKEKLKLLTVSDVAALLVQAPMTVYRRRDIPGRIKLGNAVRFREGAILHWIEKAEAATASERK